MPNDGLELPNEPYREPAYPYRKLEGTDIRLLRILPGSGTDDIECILHQIPLEEVFDFYALSYVWGDPTDLFTIILENQFFEVTRNLFAALHQFRELPSGIGSPEAYIWIDAICINQEDVDERSQQVQRMIDIYNLGSTVVWLGPIVLLSADGPSSRSPKYQMSSEEAYAFLFEKIDSMGSEWKPVDENNNLVINKMLGYAYKAVMDIMRNILERPWFERIWTLQEASVDALPTVYVGQYSTYLYRLLEFTEYFALRNRILYLCPGSQRGIAIQNIDDLYVLNKFDKDNDCKKLTVGEVFTRILGIAGAAKSTDPRDQIYGVLGIVKHLKKEELPEDLLPDYHISYTETYWNYAAFFFRTAGDLRLLNCSRNELQGVPSWVPDFRYLPAGPPIPDPSVRVTPDKRGLHLQGHILGTFLTVFPRINPEEIMPRREKIPLELTNHLKVFEELILKPSALMREITIEDAFNDMMGFATKILPVGGTTSFYDVYSTLRNSSRTRRSRTAKKQRTRSVAFKEEAIVTQFAYNYLLLHDGTILIASRKDIEVRTGDLICVFRGSGKLGLLGASGENFIFLGLCSLRGGPLKMKLDADFWTTARIQDIKLV
ncbi:HET-domain-containing protein [Daldinia eschscholtzii]|nr:HET-domain-containing protein [Daldinia eschscholtzii]